MKVLKSTIMKLVSECGITLSLDMVTTDSGEFIRQTRDNWLEQKEKGSWVQSPNSKQLERAYQKFGRDNS